MLCCDDCIHYHCYYDWCNRWKCEVNAKEAHSCFETYDDLELEMMLNYVVYEDGKLFEYKGDGFYGRNGE